jgi:chloramphenicol-sensitive protein RarD
VTARRVGPGSPATGSPGTWRRSRIVGTLVLAGTLDVVGLTVFAIGLETAPTWMVGLASSFGPVVPIIAAVAFLGERLKPIQWSGLVAIAIGMVAIAVP